MSNARRKAAVPTEALIRPTLMVTGRSASAAFSQPAAELSRLTKSGALIKIARGYYAAVPVDQGAGDWLPSMEALAAGLATAVFGYGHGVVWGLSAARAHGALPRAIATGFVCGPRQHRDISLTIRAGEVKFRKRDPERLDLEYFATDLGPGLVTSIEQTILDLSVQPFLDDDPTKAEAVITLMARADRARLAEIAGRVRGSTALARANKLVAHAQ